MMQRIRLWTQNNGAWIIPLLCSLFLFFNSGMAEVQPWDEAFYAIRAQAIVEKGAWWDQTPYALGGLYTATYPPLTEWCMAVSMWTFGENTFALRLYSLLCATALLFLSYPIALRMMMRKSALIVPLLLSGTYLWNHYARQAMLDIPLLFWIVLLLWAIIRAGECHSPKEAILWYILITISFAAALLTKIVVSFLPFLFLIYPLLRKKDNHQQSRVLLSMVLGIIVALPWHCWMIYRYGSEFAQAFLPPHFATSIENSSRDLGVFYYLNQVLVANPFSLPAFLWLILTGQKLWRQQRQQGSAVVIFIRSHSLEVLMGAWFLGGYLLFSLAATKMPHYTLLFLFPMILLSVRSMEMLITEYPSHTFTWITLVLMIADLIWSFSSYVRDSLKEVVDKSINVTALLYVAGIICFLSVAFVTTAQRRKKVIALLHPLVLYLLPLLMFLRIAILNISGKEEYISGGKAVAQSLEESGQHSFVYICYQHDDSDTLVPQLAWYTKGWTCGWRDGYSMMYQKLQFNGADTRCLHVLDSIALPIVYAQPFNDSISAPVLEYLQQKRQEVLHTRNYLLFYGKHHPITDTNNRH